MIKYKIKIPADKKAQLLKNILKQLGFQEKKNNTFIEKSLINKENLEK